MLITLEGTHAVYGHLQSLIRAAWLLEEFPSRHSLQSTRCLKSAARKLRSSPSLRSSHFRREGFSMFITRPSGSIEVLQRSTNGEACIMTEKLSVDKALEKLRGRDEPKSRMTLLDEKNKARDEETRRLRAERRRLERDNPGPPKRD